MASIRAGNTPARFARRARTTTDTTAAALHTDPVHNAIGTAPRGAESSSAAMATAAAPSDQARLTWSPSASWSAAVAHAIAGAEATAGSTAHANARPPSVRPPVAPMSATASA